MPLARATAVRAFEPFDAGEKAAAWLAATSAEDDEIDIVVAAGIALVNDALHAQAIAAADPHAHSLAPERAVAVRIGWGSGEETAAGAFSEAREVDVWATGASRRRRRQEDLRPQERVAALLRRRERPAACEVLLLRARADLDAGRGREAALQLRAGVEALLAELAGALDDDDHRRDIKALQELRPAVDAAAERALAGEPESDGDPAPQRDASVGEALEIAERVLRRRRVLAL